MRICWSRDPETLDPLALPNQYAFDAANLLYQPLLQVDFQTGAYAPALAQRLPEVRLVGDSLLELEYQLRPQAAWDNGQPVLASDVAFTLKLMHCPGLPNEGVRTQIGFIKNCRLDSADPRHLTLVCEGQAPEYSWASGDFPILPETVFDPARTLRTVSLAELRRGIPPHPAVAALVTRYRQANIGRHPERLPGSGPYQLVAWQTNRALVFKRKRTWWADRLPEAPFVLQARPQQLQFLIVPNSTAASLALQRHEVDLYPQVPVPTFRQLQRSPKAQQQFAFFTTLSYDVLTACFNTQQPALRSKYTRQALGLLLNPVALQRASQLDQQDHRTASLLAPSSPYYNDSLPLPAYNPGQAAVLLRQAGWQRQADGHWYQAAQPSAPLTLSVFYRSDNSLFATTGLQFQQAAEQLGIEVTLRPTENSLLTQSLRAGQFDVYLYVVKGSPFGVNFSPLLYSKAIGAGNLSRFNNPASDKLLDAIVRAGDPQRKQRLLRQFQQLLHEEAPLVPLFMLPYCTAADRRLRHLTLSGLKPGYAATALTWAPATAPTPLP